MHYGIVLSKSQPAGIATLSSLKAVRQALQRGAPLYATEAEPQTRLMRRG